VKLSSIKMLRLLAISLGVFAPNAGATQINWNSTSGAINQTSAGSPMSQSFVFELGSFQSGFTPEASNVADWAANWSSASRAAYSVSSSRYSAVYNFSTNVAPFTENAAAYVWGISSSEWILFRKASWLWPVASSNPLAFPIDWTTANTPSDPLMAIVGSVNGSGFLLKSASVPNQPLPALFYADWRRLYFNTTEQGNLSVSGPNADPDSDGISNVMEYARSSNPRSAVSQGVEGVSAMIYTESSQNYLGLRFFYEPRARLQFTAERNSTLTGAWSNASILSLPASPGVASFRETQPLSGSPRSFMRLSLTPSP
jgi:hypothetical protein